MTPTGLASMTLPDGIEWTGRRVTYIHPVSGGDSKGDGVPVRASDPVARVGGGDGADKYYTCCIRHSHVLKDHETVGRCGEVPTFTCKEE